MQSFRCDHARIRDVPIQVESKTSVRQKREQLIHWTNGCSGTHQYEWDAGAEREGRVLTSWLEPRSGVIRRWAREVISHGIGIWSNGDVGAALYLDCWSAPRICDFNSALKLLSLL